PVAVAERLGLAPRAALPRADVLVDLLELVRDVGEGLTLGLGPRSRRASHAIRLVVREASHLGSGELRLLLRAGRECDCGARCRSVGRHSSTIRRSFSAGSNSVVSTPSERIRYAPGKRTAAAAAVSSDTARSWSSRPSSRSRCARPGG